MRALCEVLDREGMGDSLTLAGKVYGAQEVTRAQAVSVCRALRALAKSGEIEDMGRDWARKRRKWARPEVAQAHKAWARAFLEETQARAQAREEARRAARQEGAAQ